MTPAAACRLLVLLLPLGGCLGGDGAAPDASAVVAAPAADAGPFVPAKPELGPVAISDDLRTAKDQFARENYGLAEQHFRRAVEADKTDPEAWLGLAASYDKLRRHKLADRAYGKALELTGPTAAFLNNRGYSFLMRGDLRRAGDDLTRAAALAPDDERIQANLQALDARVRERF